MVVCPAERATHGVEVFGAVGYRRRLANYALEKRGSRQLHLPQALVVSLVVKLRRDTIHVWFIKVSPFPTAKKGSLQIPSS